MCIRDRFDSGTSGSRTATFTTTADVTNFLTVPSTVNFSAATMNAFTGATNINIGNTTGTTTVNHNLTVTGDLRVNGTTTYVNSTIVDLDDPIISLGGTTDAGDAPATAANKDRGLELKYYSGSAQSGFIGLDVSEMKYKLYTNASGFDTNQVTGTLATLNLGSVEATGDINVDGTVEATTFELDASLSYTSQGSEFNSTMRNAIMKHALPSGSVIMWHGQGGIPDGYAECNGGTYTNRSGVSQPTPDFRDRFIVGQGSQYSSSIGGSYSKTTGDASNASTLAVDTSQFNIDGTALTESQIAAHTHSVNHGHDSVTINSFTGGGGTITVNTSGQGTHNHTINDDGHSHTIRGGGTSDDGGSGVPGSNNDGSHGAIQSANANVNVAANQGGHSHSVNIERNNIAASIASGSGSVASNNINSSQEGDGQAHSHNTSGSLPLTNRSHTHTISDIAPPWHSTTFIIKM